MVSKYIMSCQICVEPYNSNTRKLVSCPYCEFSACRECVETYMLQHPTPKCMNCSKELTREHIANNFTKKFVSTTYKTHREKCLFEREKAMLPATQPIVEQIIQSEKTKEKIKMIKAQIAALEAEITQYDNELKCSNKKVEPKSFIRKCPNPECRGFLSTQWKCNLCHHKTCRECNECILHPDNEHKCDPANVETVKLIAKDSKPCPKCGELIFKIEGCDQMYCTQCHTPFSWTTGRVESGAIHNPHYFEWLKTQNLSDDQAHLDIVPRCGREIDNYFVHDLLRKSGRGTAIIAIARNVIHLREVVLPKYRVDAFNDNQDLRVSFLRNQLDESTFRSTLQKREKAREKKEEYYRLLAMLIQCTTEIIYRYHTEQKDVNLYTQEIQALVDYVNNYFDKISKVYVCQRYRITLDLQMVSC